ncbi:MAG TPA: hypothetical protein VNV17_00155, partial [Solirubrobacteraceae bacterium]|nr:hypothetical protein [Solirubrobacteraceae bacterium]
EQPRRRREVLGHPRDEQRAGTQLAQDPGIIAAATRMLSKEEQVVFGLPRVATLLQGDVEGVARPDAG